MTNFEVEGIDDRYWYRTPYPELDHNHIKKHEIITDVPTLSAFDVVEKAICAKLRPSGRTGEDLDAVASYEGAIVRNGIANYIRPKRFNGQLLDGQVMLMPFDSRAATSHKPHLEGSKTLENVADGFTTLYLGRLKAARIGSIGGFMLEVTYRRMRDNPYNTTVNLVKRTVGKPKMDREDIESLLEERDQESSASWRKAKGYALAHLFPGGLPGTH